jgi:hypothetical protein
VTPGTGQHHGPVPGYRMGSPRNGMPETLGGGYRFRGVENWDPYQGNHLDPSVVKEDKEPEDEPEKRQAPEARGRSRAEKLAEFCEARDAGFSVEDAAEYAGIALNTGRKYETERRAARTAVPSGGAS